MEWTEVEKIIGNEPLVYGQPTLKMLQHSLAQNKGGALYYGTGLTTPKAVSVGLPFDVLILILVAEKLRRLFDMERIHHHIADSHALTNSFCTSEGVEALSQEYKDILGRIARLGNIALQVKFSSEFDGSNEYQEVLKTIHTDKSEYVQRELTDILWYQKKEDVRLKLGWLVQGGETAVGFDERLYDREFRKLCKEEMSFAYCVSGRTFDKQRMKAPPYISIEGETRILLKPNEDVRKKYNEAVQKWGDKNLGGAVKHLSLILRLWEKMTDSQIPHDMDTLDRTQYLINSIFS